MTFFVYRCVLLGLACLVACVFLAASQQRGKPRGRRFGQVIGLKADKMALYNKLHAEPWAAVVQRLQDCHVHNYSIYEAELEKGKWYLFAYFEYTGTDFEADMAKMAADTKTREWWTLTDPCQIRIPGTPDGQQWLTMKEVYHNA